MMEITTILAAWSAIIYGVIRAIQKSGIGQTEAWARIVPLAPLILGGVMGPVAYQLAIHFLDGLPELGVYATVVIGIGAGAVAASGHSTQKQTIRGKDERIGTKINGINDV